MDPKEIALIRRCLPERMAFPYYPDRESAWTLAQALPGDMKVAAVKQTPAAKLLTRPLIKPLVAGGGGLLRQRDVLALAHADRAMNWSGLSPVASAGLETIYAERWLDFELTLTRWGTKDDRTASQISRPGGNLVLQLGFPSEHAQLMGRYLARDARKDYEFGGHPIRTDGRPTLAWARLDIEMATGTALIEEVQTDWLRFVREDVEHMQSRTPRSRALARTEAYDARLRARYDKTWSRVLMLAALMLLREELGCREVFMHTSETGAVLKNIRGRLPPQSLYTSLPKWFGFTQGEDAPAFLHRPCRRALARLAHKGKLGFWHLAL